MLRHEIVVSKDRLAPFCVGVPQRAPLWYAAHSQMRPRVKRLPVTFSARFRADLEDFVPVEVLAEFAKTGCPVKNILLTIAFCFCLFFLPDTNNIFYDEKAILTL